MMYGLVLLLTVQMMTVQYTAADCNPDLPDGSQCPELGFALYPDPDNCADFWQCTDGCAVKMSCPTGNVYDDVNHWCDSMWIVDCGSRPGPNITKTTTTTSTTTESECGHSLDCTNLPNGWYPNIYNCRRFFVCENGQSDSFACPEDYLWDSDNHWCDFPDRVNCGQRPICDACDDNCITTTVTTPTPPTTTTEDDTLHCTEYCHGDGDFAMGCCNNTFCKCEGGVGYPYPCPNGLVFVQEKDYCDYRANVPCCNQG